MPFLHLLIWAVVLLAGCITPAAKDSRTINSPIMNAYQASLPQEKSSPWTFPLTPQNQSYAIAVAILVLMVIVILRTSQFKDK